MGITASGPSAGRSRSRPVAWAFGLVLLLAGFAASVAHAAVTGKVGGKIVATDTGEPIGFAEVALVPADSTMHPVGGLTNADGTFLLEAPAGRYALRIRALSYMPKRVEVIVIEPGTLLPFDAALAPEAIPQKEIVVEGKRRENTEASMLAARKKAVALGDAVSAEQVRKSPDRDAAEVLRRVTGLSVSDGKYVFVRGLGERYSSTEIDGVRIASPEQNKRVVPLDLLPANLLENIVVQKTYTADRPGEFGGGDVQVHTKDFPGNRTWQLSVSQGWNEGATFHRRQADAGGNSDLFGFDALSRLLPDPARAAPLPSPTNRNLPDLAAIARSFNNDWSPRSARTLPNGSYSATYGDQLALFGRPLGLIGSWSLSRSFDQQDESQRFFESNNDTLYDYAVRRWTQSSQLGGISGLSYRLSPRHTLHLRGLYTRSADDEVRTYEGPDHNREDIYGQPLVHRSTRFSDVDRRVASGTVEGTHEFSQLLGTQVDWKLSRSSARRQKPDTREYVYDRRYYFEGDTAHWVFGSLGSREFGDMHDQGSGGTVRAALPYALGRLGSGKLVIGYDRQIKDRENLYRRFNVTPNDRVRFSESPPDTLFDPSGFDGSPGTGYISETTLNESHGSVDNYRAHQRVTAGYLSLDVPLGSRVRGNLGVRRERGFQDVISFYEFKPDSVLEEGRLDDVDWLPSGNLTWAVSDLINLRLAASRTVSRPDLNELSPSPFLDYVGGFLIRGNPDLKRARIENYDVRLEAFPALSEVVAAGFFYKRLEHPIEQVIQGGAMNLLVPRNSDRGRNLGLELEARSGLGRIWRRLHGLSVNSNASFISSAIHLQPQVSKLGTETHPLQGQARYLVNVALSYASPGRAMDVAVLWSATGRRLETLGLYPLPDVYEQPTSTLDATLNLAVLGGLRMKLAAKNLLDPRIQRLQAGKEVSGFRRGRGASIAVSYGS